MNLAKHFTNILLVSSFIFLSSCSGREETSTRPATATLTPTDVMSSRQSLGGVFWSDIISNAESLWLSSKIESYEVVGRVWRAGQEYTFQISVANGEIVDSRCQSYSYSFMDNKWCETEFEANDYAIPALFYHARELLKFAEEIAQPGEDCFRFVSDSFGVPTHFWLDCRQIYDEEVDWEFIFFNNMP